MKIIMALIAVLLFTGVGHAERCLTWNAPVANEDGTPLKDLAGYRVYEVRAPGAEPIVTGYPKEVNTHCVDDTGKYTLWVTAYDESGNESVPSNIRDNIRPGAPSCEWK